MHLHPPLTIGQRPGTGRLAAIAAVAALAAAAAALPTPAVAGRPLITDTADAKAAGVCDIDIAHTHERGGGETTRTADGSLSCGVGASTEVGIAFARDRSAGTSSRSGGLSAKTTFVMPASGVTGFGLAYGLDAARRGGDWRSDTLFALLIATREVAPGVLAHANLGTAHSRIDRRDTTTWSLGVETTANPRVAADLYGDDRDPPFASAGVGWGFGPGLDLNLTHAVQLGQPRVRVTTLGARVTF